MKSTTGSKSFGLRAVATVFFVMSLFQLLILFLRDPYQDAEQFEIDLRDLLDSLRRIFAFGSLLVSGTIAYLGARYTDNRPVPDDITWSSEDNVFIALTFLGYLFSFILYYAANPIIINDIIENEVVEPLKRFILVAVACVLLVFSTLLGVGLQLFKLSE